MVYGHSNTSQGTNRPSRSPHHSADLRGIGPLDAQNGTAPFHSEQEYLPRSGHVLQTFERLSSWVSEADVIFGGYSLPHVPLKGTATFGPEVCCT